MLKLKIEDLGNGRDELILNIELTPNFSRTSDSYYLFDFLEIADDEIENQKLNYNSTLTYGAIKLLEYWTERIKSIKKNEVKFIPFDLWDEYIGGLLIEHTDLGYKIKLASTDQINGFGINKSTIDAQLEKIELDSSKNKNLEWLVSKSDILEGLERNRYELTE